MKRHIFLCLILFLSVMPGGCRSVSPFIEKGNSHVHLSVQLDSKWSALNTCRNAYLLVTYRNNSKEPVMIVSPEVLHLEFRNGKQVVRKFDGFTYETNIHLWGIILGPKSEYCTEIPLRLFLRTKKIVPGEWNVNVRYRQIIKKEWVGSEFPGTIKYVRGKNIKSPGRFYDTIITSDKAKNLYYLLIQKDHKEFDHIEIITDTLVSNSVNLRVEKCGWVEKFLWKVKVWFSQW